MAGRGGKRAGAGRPKNAAETPASAPTKNLASKILAGLGKPNGHEPDCKCEGKCAHVCRCEECLWKRDAESPGADGSWARKYLWDLRDGKPVSTVNHLHDKPMELTVTHTLSEKMRIAMKKAEKRVSRSR
jgi:hypothetical protein